MKRLLFIFLLASSSLSSYAQSFTHEQITSFSYEDMSDFLRRFPGMYPMDYGVLGAPIIIRPWGLSPWLTGAERDGIPWNRVSDGLWNSNLDAPDDMDTLRVEHNGTEPFGRFTWSRRVIPSDSPRTELHVREGYYGFGRIDFAHAQRFSPKLEAEASGRLNWYDGMRTNISKARLYNLRGSLTYNLSDAWIANLEYGGANTDVQSPHKIITDTLTGATTRISVFDEREYGTLRLKKQTERHSLDFGVHLRQDRENHDNYFRLREQLWYGFASASIHRGPWSGSAKLDYEHSNMDFPGVVGLKEDQVACHAGIRLHSAAGAARLAVHASAGRESSAERKGGEKLNAYAGSLDLSTRKWLGSSIVGGIGRSSAHVPVFWRRAQYSLMHRPLLVIDDFVSPQYRYAGAETLDRSTESRLHKIMRGGVEWTGGGSRILVMGHNIDSDDAFFAIQGEAVFLSNQAPTRAENGLSLDADVKLLSWLRLQSWGFSDLPRVGVLRAEDTRSYSRVLFEKDFLKAPLHIASFVAYEHIGRHEATSDLGSETVGPAHLMHVQVAATIQGVTLLWGVDNLTGQHYYYLPGYPMIAKEEYFGLRWTLTL